MKGAVRRYLARVFNALLIDRKDIKVHQSPVDLMLREIGDTHSLIVFPEGHRNTGPELGEFKSGLYYLCKKRPDLEAIPVHLDNMNRILPRGEVLPVPLLSCITFGPPIWLEKGEPKVDFLARARESVLKLKDICIAWRPGNAVLRGRCVAVAGQRYRGWPVLEGPARIKPQPGDDQHVQSTCPRLVVAVFPACRGAGLAARRYRYFVWLAGVLGVT